METRFGPLVREKLALWPVLFIRLFLEEDFLSRDDRGEYLLLADKLQAFALSIFISLT
jgi:hypothetical protein